MRQTQKSSISVDDRLEILIDREDVVAAAQILSWIARPHRPESGVQLLNHWYLRLNLIHGASKGDMSFVPEKVNRLEPQFYRLQTDCLTGFRAGVWLNWKLLSASPLGWFSNVDVSTRELSRRRARARNARPENEFPDNEIRDVWSKRKPIAHLALGAGNSIGRSLAKKGLHGFGLSEAVLNPAWVEEAIIESEEWAHSAATCEALNGTKLYRFRRDTF